ncbi:MAG: electron transfer flavoprotein subunit alpha [Candidatus Latescibacteria bacterium]|jgi:electron transfer flavoprotein alpha subunit|nr:electron transfer flavoprotein subunit alpha [Candidatus Latescibacterota bacterium]
MERILLLAHTQDDGTLPKAALEALGASIEVSGALAGSTVAVGLIGGEVRAAADAISGCGAETFLAVTGPEFGVSRYGSDVEAATALVSAAEATLVMAPASSRFCRSLPGAAQRLQGRIDTRVTGIAVEGEGIQIERWYYRQRMAATLTRSQRPWFVLLDSGVYEPWTGEAGSASITDVTVDLPEQRTQVKGLQAAAAEAQTIRPDADLLLVAGAGWTKKQADGEAHVGEAEGLILGFLDKTQASLGSSKSLVDQQGEGQEVLSCLSHVNQVGQTGATPRHPKGLATCCHGEEPHVVGWRFVNERRAVNTDPGCGWAQGKADVLYVADAFEVMAKVNELLG